MDSTRILLFSGSALLALTSFARIVHTPAAAVASGSNPASVNGATWSVHRRIWWNDANNDTAANALNYTSSRTDGLVGFCKGTTVPYVLVNNGNTPLSSADIFGDSSKAGFVTCENIAPGEIVLHPERYSETDANRVVLQFTVPRTGRYSLEALFRTLNGLSWNSKVADVSILLDGTLLFQDELAHPDAAERKSFAFSNKYLLAGQTLDIVFGSGLTEVNVNAIPSHQGDAVGMKLSIVEEDETEDSIAADWNLGTAYWQAWGQEAKAIPFPAGEKGGTWSFYSTAIAPYFYEYASPILLDQWIADGSVSGPRVSREGKNNTTEHVTVYDPTATVSALAGLGTSIPTGGSNLLKYPDRIGPGEISFHPASDRNLVFRFTVPEDGRYVASYALRDVSCHHYKPSDGNGVIVSVNAGSVYLGETFISREKEPVMVFNQVTTPTLKAGTAVDFLVNNNGHYAYDGTAGQIRIFKLRDSVPAHSFCAASALRENAKGSNASVFTDDQGATWTIGMSTSPLCADLTPLGGSKASTKTMERYNTDGSMTRFTGIPRLVCNTTLEALDHAADANVVSGHVLFPNEYLVHPTTKVQNNIRVFSVLRFSAPTTGIYALEAVVRDVDAAANVASGLGGVVFYAMGPEGAYLGAGYACSDSNNSFVWSHVNNGFVYLAAGESIDFCVAPKEGRTTNCDATAIYENIHFAEADTEPILGIDITPAGTGGRYVARGRVGWSDQAWSRTVAAESGLQASNMKAGDKVAKTVFSVTRAAGEIATTLDEAQAKDLLKGGVVSTGESDTYTFTLTDLAPDTSYRLFLYGRSVSDGAQPVFAVNGQEVSPSLSWSRPFVDEVAVVTATSDATGTLTGSFHASTEGQAAFCGLQVAEGEVPLLRGLMVLIK